MIARTIALAAVGLGALATPASASCVPRTDEERLGSADLVFVGKVVSVSGAGASALFRINRSAKGEFAKGDEVEITADPYPSSVTISWNPRKGQRWRVFAVKRGGRWTTDDCLGTHRVRGKKRRA
jgi:hypothetical protein